MIDIPFAYKHDLIYLLNLIDTATTVEDSWYDKLISLQQYAVILRYPNDIIEPTNEEIQAAIFTAQEVKIWALSLVIV